jgi:hypothetical protein
MTTPRRRWKTCQACGRRLPTTAFRILTSGSLAPACIDCELDDPPLTRPGQQGVDKPPQEE